MIYLQMEDKKMSNCIYILIQLFYQGDESLCTTKNFMLLLLLRCLFIQLFSFCTPYHIPSFSVYSHAATTFLLRKMTRFSLSPSNTLTFARRESLSTSHDAVVNVRFLHCYYSLSPSFPVDSYLFLTYKRKTYNKSAQRVDKLFYAAYASVYVLPFATTHFFLHIINFPFL